jgi:hypothetical protein
LIVKDAKYYILIDKLILGVNMLHYEAIEFLDEIAKTKPEILQSASCIDLKKTVEGDVEIVIHCHLANYDLQMLNRLVSAKKLKVINSHQDVWVIH